jgi:hypothetical protein
MMNAKRIRTTASICGCPHRIKGHTTKLRQVEGAPRCFSAFKRCRSQLIWRKAEVCVAGLEKIAECAETSGRELFCSDFRADKGVNFKKTGPNPGSAASLPKHVGRKEILAWRRSPNFAKWRTTSTRGREHRVIRFQSKSSGSRPTTILKRPSNCGAAKIPKSGFSKKTEESTTESTIYTKFGKQYLSVSRPRESRRRDVASVSRQVGSILAR